MKKLLFCFFAVFLALASAQQATTPDPGYANVSIAGLPSTIPTLDTALKNWLEAVENTSIQALVAQGGVNPDAIANNAINMAKTYCAESQGTMPGCADPAATAAPYASQAKLVFSLVPASQWDLKTFSAHLPVFASAYIKPVVVPPPATPPAKPLVGQCYGFGAVQMCNPGPGASASTVANGTVVTQDGKKYVAVVTAGGMIGLGGPAIYFEPVGP